MIGGRVGRRFVLPQWLASPPAWVVNWAPVAILPPVLVLDALFSHSGNPLTVVNVGCAVLVCIPLAARHRLGVAAMVPLLVGGVVLVMWQLHPGNTVVLIPMVGVYELARRFDRRRALWIAALCVPGVLAGVLPFADGAAHTADLVVRNLVLCLLAVAAGDMVRSRRETSERAADLREQQTLRRVADERLAIAHEIHDLVAHGMTSINVQAGVAAHLLDRDPAQARSALRDIKRVSGEALTELRATLAVLRDPGQAAPLEPAGGLEDLAGLVGGARAAGVAVELEVGELGELGPAVHHAGYRIVQEALTNVARHSGARAARVRVHREHGMVAIEVADDGRGTGGDSSAPGNGVRGMRERARALGGTVEAGPPGAAAEATDRGWTVHARLPVATPAVGEPAPTREDP
jgi:signal transduction histidine kinase